MVLRVEENVRNEIHYADKIWFERIMQLHHYYERNVHCIVDVMDGKNHCFLNGIFSPLHLLETFRKVLDLFQVHHNRVWIVGLADRRKPCKAILDDLKCWTWKLKLDFVIIHLFDSKLNWNVKKKFKFLDGVLKLVNLISLFKIQELHS
jgi:hypothetical protein